MFFALSNPRSHFLDHKINGTLEKYKLWRHKLYFAHGVLKGRRGFHGRRLFQGAGIAQPQCSPSSCKTVMPHSTWQDHQVGMPASPGSVGLQFRYGRHQLTTHVGYTVSLKQTWVTWWNPVSNLKNNEKESQAKEISQTTYLAWMRSQIQSPVGEGSSCYEHLDYR